MIGISIFLSLHNQRSELAFWIWKDAPTAF